MYRVDICQQIGCEWGKAASGNLIAQIMYLIAAIFHRCMPTPRETAAERRAAKEEKKRKKAEAEAEEAEAKAAAAEAQTKEMEEAKAASPGPSSPAVTGLEEQ